MTIRHRDLRERLAVHQRIFLDDVVLVEEIGGQCIGLVRAERSALIRGHGAVDDVEDRRRKWTVTANRERSIVSGTPERHVSASHQSRAADQITAAVDSGDPLQVCSVAIGALPRIDSRAFLCSSLPGRESFPRRTDSTGPRLDLFLGRSPAYTTVARRLRLRLRLRLPLRRDAGDSPY